VKGTQQEFEKMVEDVKGHSLTLNSLGSYLRDAHAGDIRRRDLINWRKQTPRSWAAMPSTSWMPSEVVRERLQDRGGQCKRLARPLTAAAALLLFDRPATADCLNALWTGVAIV
jgi:hypothetical protein